MWIFSLKSCTRKHQTLLNKELEKKEIQEGLIKACDVIDLIIEILRGSQSIKDAKACLVNGETENIKFKVFYFKKNGRNVKIYRASGNCDPGNEAL